MNFTKKSKVRVIALVVAVASTLPVGSAHALTLMQAFQAALANDPTYQQAEQDAIGGKEYKVLGRAGLLPNVQASYSANRNRVDLEAPNFLGQRTTTHPEYVSRSAAVTLRQTLFNMDAWARYKQGIAQVGYSDANFAGRGQDLITRVIGAYIDALFASEQVRIATAQRDMYVEQKSVNDLLFAKGEGTKTDMLETQSRLDLSEAQLLEASDNQQTQLAALSTIVGQEVTTLDELAPNFRIAEMPEGGFEAWRKIALEENPDLRAQKFAIEASRQEVTKSRAGHLPRLDFVASYSKADAETINTYNQNTVNRTIGIQLVVPLYSGGSVSASSRQSVAGLEKAKSELQVRTDRILIDLRKQYSSAISSVAKIRALEKAVSSGELLVTATEQSIKGGVRINLDLLNARQQLYSSMRDLAQARYTYLVARMKLRADAGIAGPDDVQEMSSYFR
ncbi:TolC family outer membrane protein [Duganella aceris]|uniref:TolC family outer membrane protein n=1 Tax=Duganella aceris TaxID=2703883 RepID=A0ABX0FPW8_9BURK|nr:TolC family outer membrane protein [Duganella aceris]NGZ86527.1 TolC family outer membrane protein [Duganella aceris]